MPPRCDGGRCRSRIALDTNAGLFNNPTRMPRLLVLLSAVCFGTTGTAQALGPDAAPLTVGAVRIAVGARCCCSSRVPCPRRRPPGRGASWVRSRSRSPSTSSRSSPRSTARAWRSGRSSRSAPRPRSPAWPGRLVDGEPLTGRWAAATALACAGVLLLVLGGGGASVDPLGIMLAVVSGTGYATYTVLAKRLLRLGHAPERVMAASFSLGALLLVPVLVLGDVRWLQRRRDRDGALPRRDPHRARVRPVRARAAAPDAGGDGDAHARRAAHRDRPRRARARRAPRRRRRGRRRARARRPAGAGAAVRAAGGCHARRARRHERAAHPPPRLDGGRASPAALRTRILDGELAAGERLRELELADAYGVARHSLRAALRALAAEGLVTIEPNRGARVASLDGRRPRRAVRAPHGARARGRAARARAATAGASQGGPRRGAAHGRGLRPARPAVERRRRRARPRPRGAGRGGAERRGSSAPTRHWPGSCGCS